MKNKIILFFIVFLLNINIVVYADELDIITFDSNISTYATVDSELEGNFYLIMELSTSYIAYRCEKVIERVGSNSTVCTIIPVEALQSKKDNIQWSPYSLTNRSFTYGSSYTKIYTNIPFILNNVVSDFTKFDFDMPYVGYDWYTPYDNLSKDFIENFEFDDYKAYFYTPSNNGTVNLHYKDEYFWKFNARLYVKFDGDPFITDKKILEMLISNLQLSSPFELYNPVGTYVQRPSLLNGFKGQAYIDFKIGFPSDFEFGEYILTASFPGSGTKYTPDIKSATIKIKLTNDGGKQEGVFDSNGNLESNGNNNNNSTDESISSFPTAPSDGSVGDWFKYIGDLVIWLVTYPFKLLSDVFNVLGGYINSMMRELEETARAMNGLLTFIPQDILNVAYGFISFTLLYSVVRGVLKLIRG